MREATSSGIGKEDWITSQGPIQTRKHQGNLMLEALLR
jgi:hypothetical protein